MLKPCIHVRVRARIRMIQCQRLSAEAACRCIPSSLHMHVHDLAIGVFAEKALLALVSAGCMCRPPLYGLPWCMHTTDPDAKIANQTFMGMHKHTCVKLTTCIPLLFMIERVSRSSCAACGHQVYGR